MSQSLRIAVVVVGALGVLPAIAGTRMTPGEIESHRNVAGAMFADAFGAYMARAFPHDELRPISGSWTDSLIELGNVPRPKRDGYSGVAMTLIDSLDTLAVLGNRSAFADAVRWVGTNVRFDQDAVVSVFETTIRVLGGLLSAHVLAAGDMPGFAHIRVPAYDGELLDLARDLGERLLPAFEEAPSTGLPFPFVHLQHGVGAQPVPEQCAAGVGTNLLEFALLSNLTADDRYARASLRALGALWARRSPYDLVGNTLNIHTGEWVNSLAGIGAGVDSFYEYLAKGAVFLDAPILHSMWTRAYGAVEAHLRVGTRYVTADMHRPRHRQVHTYGALQAFWPGLQALVGDVDEAVETHAEFMRVWDAFGTMPETYTVRGGDPAAGPAPYPLRPEVAESTLVLFRATGDHKYLRFGARMLASLNRVARAPYGYASVASVLTGRLSDHMPSYFLAETVKYLYLLFDPENHALQLGSRRLTLSTEAHFFPVLGRTGLPADVWGELSAGVSAAAGDQRAGGEGICATQGADGARTASAVPPGARTRAVVITHSP